MPLVCVSFGNMLTLILMFVCTSELRHGKFTLSHVCESGFGGAPCLPSCPVEYIKVAFKLSGTFFLHLRSTE